MPQGSVAGTKVLGWPCCCCAQARSYCFNEVLSTGKSHKDYTNCLHLVQVQGSYQDYHWSKLCTACPGNPSSGETWPTTQFAGCSALDSETCPWGSVCVRGSAAGRNGCIKRVFGYGIEPFIALEGCSAVNQQWIVRDGVVGSPLV